MHVDAIQERTGELFLVVFDVAGATGTFVSWVAEVATGTGVHGGDKHEIGGVGGFSRGAGDGDRFVFERLAEGFQDRTGKFRELV